MKRNILEFSVELPVNAVSAFAWHARPGALSRLLPPWENAAIIATDGFIRDGSKVQVRFRWLGPLKKTWVVEHFGYLENVQFCDRQISGPFVSFEHCRRFEPVNNSTCRLTERLEYQLPWGPLGATVASAVRRRIEQGITFRRKRLQSDLRRHAAFSNKPRMKVAVTGSTGLVGSALVPFLTTGGHRVIRLVREVKKSDLNDGTTSVVWNPSQGKLDPQALEGVDAVVHLAGESIATGRWTNAKKQRIRASRVLSTQLLAEMLTKLKKPPRVFFSASAIGYYPHDRDERAWVESDPPGDSFLAEVCQAWEAATLLARQASIRTVLGRLGMVVAGNGGALSAQLPLFRMGLAGRIGSGQQVISWIDLNDLIGAIYYCLMDDSLSGPVNCTAPTAVTNYEFTKSLGKVLRRPTVLPVPAPILRLALGEMADALLLSSQRVAPRKLVEAGFKFDWPELEGALRMQLGRMEK